MFHYSNKRNYEEWREIQEILHRPARCLKSGQCERVNLTCATQMSFFSPFWLGVLLFVSAITIIQLSGVSEKRTDWKWKERQTFTPTIIFLVMGTRLLRIFVTSIAFIPSIHSVQCIQAYAGMSSRWGAFFKSFISLCRPPNSFSKGSHAKKQLPICFKNQSTAVIFL